MSLLADEVALLKLQGLWDYGGAANAATGLASLKTAADVGTAAAGGAGIMGFDPASIIFSLALKAMGIGPSGTQATPMTPEERELFNTAQKVDTAVDLAQKASTGNFDYEGQGETVEATALDALDAVNALSDSDLEFFGDTKDFLLDKLVNAGVDSSTSSQGVKGKWYDPETGEVLPDFNPNTGEGMGTLFPTFYPDSVADPGGGGGGGDTAASSEAASAASAASSQADSGTIGTGDWVYDAGVGVFRQSGGSETFTPVPGTYTDGQTVSYNDAAAVFGTWGDNSNANTSTTPTSTSTTNSGASNTGLNLPNVLYLPEFGGTSTTGSSSDLLSLPEFVGTSTTGTTGTGTTGTGTTGTGTANTGGTGGGLSTGTGTGDGAGTGSGTGTGDGAGDGSGTGDGTGDGSGTGDGTERVQELADIVSGGTGGGMRTVKTEKAGLADITNTYDPSLSLAENMALMLGTKTQEEDAVNSALMYGGGIVQPTDINAEISRILGNR